VLVEADDVRALAAALVRSDAVAGVTIADGVLHVETDNLRTLGTAVPSLASELGVRVTAFRPEDDSLESVFRYLVHRR
jgi:ABC-2 type transport system ATP-binding protein